MYQIYTFTNEWTARNTYDNVEVARWILENQVVNHMACVVDTTTGEVLLEK